MELLGWLKRVKPYTKKLLRLYSNPENDLVELIHAQKEVVWTGCKLDKTSLAKVVSIISGLMAAGKMQTAADFCTELAEKCFGKSEDNPYRLMLLSIAMIAKCESKFYDLNFFRQRRKENPLKLRYLLCQESSFAFLEMEPTIFKISELLAICEELSHFACFRQCHVNFMKNLAAIDEDEDVDWFDRVRVLEALILALIHDSDIAGRLIESEKEQKQFNQKLKQHPEPHNSQYCFSWFNHLHHQEICTRGTAAMEVLRADPAFQNFDKGLKKKEEEAQTESTPDKVELPRMRKILRPRNPGAEEEARAKRLSGQDSGVLADADMIALHLDGNLKKTKKPKRLFDAQRIYATDVDDMNYAVRLKNGKTFSDLNAEKVKERSKARKVKEKFFDGGGEFSIDPRKRMTSQMRRKIRLVARKIMYSAREMQMEVVEDDELLNQAYPATDDECSDDEEAPNPFIRLETLETLRKKNMRKFGTLNAMSDVKQVVWWENAKDELLASRAIENHCVKVMGESSEPFNELEEYLGKSEDGSGRNRMAESKRKTECRIYNEDLERDKRMDDGCLMVLPPNPFKSSSKTQKRQQVSLNSLLLQNLRRRCVDELTIILLVIRAQQQLQDGNIIRSVAYLMLIEYKLAVLALSPHTEIGKRENKFDPYLLHLYKCLLAKFRLYATDLYGESCLNPEEKMLIDTDINSKAFNLNDKCFEFCRETKATFFCICVRGRVISLDSTKFSLEREKVEKQHEFFFGLDNTSKNTHLSTFWRLEVAPIVSGLIHITSHFLLNHIDKFGPKELKKTIDEIEEISESTKEWLHVVTKKGVLVQRTHKSPVDTKNVERNCVPMLFQLPSRINASYNTVHMVKKDSLESIYKSTTKFVREKHELRKNAISKKSNTSNMTKSIMERSIDIQYNKNDNLTFFGEPIEKNVYMVAVYKGEKIDEIPKISQGMKGLCRKIRSQSGFVTIDKFN